MIQLLCIQIGGKKTQDLFINNFKMRKYFFSGKFLKLFQKIQKRKFFLYVGLLIFASILELFGLSLIIPIISKSYES